MEKNTGNSVNSLHSKKLMIPFLFSIFVCLLIHFWFLQYSYYFSDDFNVIMSVSRRKNILEQFPKDSRFILVWNKYNNNILTRFGIQNGLLNCSTNCVFTDDRNLLYDYIRYDGIIFNEFALRSNDKPKRRSKFQFYIFSSQKSSYDTPACDPCNDNFFNLTFSYKLNSDVLWNYIAVRNLSGAMVAPKVSVNWEKSLKAVSNKIRAFLVQKRKAAIWTVNNNKGKQSNVEYLTRLQEHLFHYSLKIDAYGQPPLLRCPNNDCQRMIREKYYFYIAFENSFSEDHVTDIVLNGYNNYAVPVVYGGANYNRFLPPGSYINARNFHPYNLAYEIHKAINDPILYEDYFRWTNIYTIQNTSKSHTSLCNLCETIHKYKENSTAKQSMKKFRRWWNGLNGMKRCLSQAYRNENFNLNRNYVFIKNSLCL